MAVHAKGDALSVKRRPASKASYPGIDWHSTTSHVGAEFQFQMETVGGVIMRCDERNVSQRLPALGGLGETERPVKEGGCESAKLATQGQSGGCALRLCGGGEGVDVAAAGSRGHIDMYGAVLDGAGSWASAAAHARLMKRAAAPSFPTANEGLVPCRD